MSYTKGPWSFNVIRKCPYIGGENHVEYELKDSEGKDIMPTIENVRLHAAAPELFEALQDAVDNCLWKSDRGPISKEESQRIYDKACAAIAKARGEK